MTPLLVPAGPEHAPALEVIHAAAFPPAEAWSADAMAEQLMLPGCFGLIQPEGGMIIMRVVLDEAEVLTLAVAPCAQRRGLGWRLLQAGLDQAVAAGATTCFLEVSVTNSAASGLYRSVGFVQVGRRTAYYPDGADALVMRLDL